MFRETKPNANWFKVQNWVMDKLVNTEGGLIPMDKEAMAKRSEPQFDYQVVLETASRTMIRFKKPERLIKMIVQVIDEQLRTSHTAVLLYKENKNAFVLIDSKGAEGVKIPINFIRMTFDNPLIKIFNERQNYIISDTGTLSYGELKELLRNKRLSKSIPNWKIQ